MTEFWEFCKHSHEVWWITAMTMIVVYAIIAAYFGWPPFGGKRR